MSGQAAPNLFSLEVERSPDAAVVRCRGRLVSGSQDAFYTEVRQLMQTSKGIVLDLTDLTNMDSAGVGTLVRLYVSSKSANATYS